MPMLPRLGTVARAAQCGCAHPALPSRAVAGRGRRLCLPQCPHRRRLGGRGAELARQQRGGQAALHDAEGKAAQERGRVLQLDKPSKRNGLAYGYQQEGGAVRGTVQAFTRFKASFGQKECVAGPRVKGMRAQSPFASPPPRAPSLRRFRLGRRREAVRDDKGGAGRQRQGCGPERAPVDEQRDTGLHQRGGVQQGVCVAGQQWMEHGAGLTQTTQGLSQVQCGCEPQSWQGPKGLG
jgi:hypothetical protein